MTKLLELLLNLLSVGTGTTQNNSPNEIAGDISSQFPNLLALPCVSDYMYENFGDSDMPHPQGRPFLNTKNNYEREGMHWANTKDHHYDYYSEEYHDSPYANPSRSQQPNRKQNHGGVGSAVPGPSNANPIRPQYPEKNQDFILMGPGLYPAPMYPYENGEQHGRPQAYQPQEYQPQPYQPQPIQPQPYQPQPIQPQPIQPQPIQPQPYQPQPYQPQPYQPQPYQPQPYQPQPYQPQPYQPQPYQPQPIQPQPHQPQPIQPQPIQPQPIQPQPYQPQPYQPQPYQPQTNQPQSQVNENSRIGSGNIQTPDYLEIEKLDTTGGLTPPLGGGMIGPMMIPGNAQMGSPNLASP